MQKKLMQKGDLLMSLFFGQKNPCKKVLGKAIITVSNSRGDTKRKRKIMKHAKNISNLSSTFNQKVLETQQTGKKLS